MADTAHDRLVAEHCKTGRNAAVGTVGRGRPRIHRASRRAAAVAQQSHEALALLSVLLAKELL